MEAQASDILNQLTQFAVGYGTNVIGALVVLVLGWVAAGWARRAVRAALDRSGRVDETLKSPIASTVRYLVLILVVIAVLSQFGVQIASILAILGAAGLAVGLALQGTLSNVAAGMMLLFLRPFKVGDFIDADGIAGTVTEIGLFTSELTTYDGVYLGVPNSQLWNRPLKNYSRLPTRRLDVVVGISYDDDIDRALAVLGDELERDARVLADPAPQVMVTALADSSVNLNLRCWTNAADYWGLLFDLTKGAKQRLEAEGFTIPFPQRDVHVRGTPLAAVTSEAASG
jgi:small conductance mechanosensitive channel